MGKRRQHPLVCPHCGEAPPGVFFQPDGTWRCAEHDFEGERCPGSESDVTAEANAIIASRPKAAKVKDLGPLFAWVPPPEPTSTSDTIALAKESFHSKLPAGAVCPCCDRFGKSYRRKINAGMAMALLWLVHRSESQRGKASELPWVDVPADAPRELLAKGRDFTILRYWGLIERQEIRVKTAKKKKHPGLWRPTAKGVTFARGHAAVPSHAIVYNDSVSALDGEPVTIKAALGEQFDYDELISTWGAPA